MKKCFFVILLVNFQVFYSLVFAQFTSRNFTIYPEFEGILITDVITDSRGIVWITTATGLVQYDGYEYNYYGVDPKDPKKMGSLLTSKLFEARDGHIWIGCIGLLCEYNPVTKTFKNYDFIKQTDFPLGSRPMISTISEDLSGRIYFGTTSFIGMKASHALFYKERDSDKLKRFDSPKNEEIKNVYSITADHLGNIWVFAANGFFRIDEKQNIHKDKWPIANFFNNQYYSTIKCDVKGNVWMISSNAFYSILSVLNPTTGEERSYSLKQSFDKIDGEWVFTFNKMEFDSKGNIWLATSNGLIYFDSK